MDCTAHRGQSLLYDFLLCESRVNYLPHPSLCPLSPIYVGPNMANDNSTTLSAIETREAPTD